MPAKRGTEAGPLFPPDRGPRFAIGPTVVRAAPPAGYVEALLREGPRIDSFDEEWTWNAAWAGMTIAAVRAPGEIGDVLSALIAATRRSPFFQPSEARPVPHRFALMRLVFPLLVAIDATRSDPAASHRLAVEHGEWLSAVVATETSPAAVKSGELSARNNHTLLAGVVAMVWGELTGNAGSMERGLAAFRATVAGMEADGCLPSEAVRGASAAWYTNLAIMLMVSIAHLSRQGGSALLDEPGYGPSLDKAIAFLLDAIDDPSRLWRHSRENRFPHPRHGADPFQIDLSFLETYHRSRHYLAWIPLYLAQRSDSPHAERLKCLLDRSPALLPMINEFAGGAVERMLKSTEAT